MWTSRPLPRLPDRPVTSIPVRTAPAHADSKQSSATDSILEAHRGSQPLPVVPTRLWEQLAALDGVMQAFRGSQLLSNGCQSCLRKAASCSQSASGRPSVGRSTDPSRQPAAVKTCLWRSLRTGPLSGRGNKGPAELAGLLRATAAETTVQSPVGSLRPQRGTTPGDFKPKAVGVPIERGRTARQERSCARFGGRMPQRAGVQVSSISARLLEGPARTMPVLRSQSALFEGEARASVGARATTARCVLKVCWKRLSNR